MKISIWFLSLMLFATGCATRTSHDNCQYRERDLTVPFEQRTYWCIPHQIEKRP